MSAHVPIPPPWDPFASLGDAVVEPVAPVVLEEAVGSCLVEGERIAAATFVPSVKGPMLRTGMDGGIPSLVVVTDRRLIRVLAWFWAGAYSGSEVSSIGDAVRLYWQCGKPLVERASLARRSLWLGDVLDDGVGIRRVKISGERLFVGTARGEHSFGGPLPELGLLEGALLEALSGPGRHALAPPPVPQPVPVGGWGARVLAILRPARPGDRHRPDA